MNLMDKILQNVLEINTLSLQIVAWVNECRKNDNLIFFDDIKKNSHKQTDDSAALEDCKLNNVIRFCKKIKTENDKTKKGIIFNDKEISAMPANIRNLFKIGQLKAHIRKKNGYYEIRCSINGKAISACSKKLCDAKERFIDKLFVFREEEFFNNFEGTHTFSAVKAKSAQTTVSNYAKKWLENVKRPYVKEITYSNYVSLFEKEIFPVFGNTPIKSVKQMDLQNFINSYTDSGRSRTAQKLCQLLKAMFEYAVADEAVSKNPMKLVKAPLHEATHGVPVTRSEEKIFIQTFMQSPTTYAQAYAFMLYTGLRRSELVTANLTEKWIEVKTAKQRKGKREKLRRVPISPMLRKVLPLINLEEIKKLPLDGLSRFIKQFFPDHHTHDLRHTFITRCQECGIQVELVSLWAGHVNGNSITSSVYTHLEQFEDNQLAEIKKFSYIL